MESIVRDWRLATSILAPNASAADRNSFGDIDSAAVVRASATAPLSAIAQLCAQRVFRVLRRTSQM